MKNASPQTPLQRLIMRARKEGEGGEDAGGAPARIQPRRSDTGRRRFAFLQRGLRFEILFNLTLVILFTLGLIGYLLLKETEATLLEQERLRDEQTVMGFQRVLDLFQQGAKVDTRVGEIQNLLTRFSLAEGMAEAYVLDPQQNLMAYFLARDSTLVSTTDKAMLERALGSNENIYFHAIGSEAPFFDTSEGHYVFYAQVTLGPSKRGVFKAVFALSEVRESLRRSRLHLALFLMLESALLLVFGGVLLNRILLRPLLRLQAQTRRIAEGGHPPLLSVPRNNELGELVEGFNEMSVSLQENERRLRDQVDELARLNRELIERRQEVIQSEKMAGVGRLSAALAHEIGNPLGAAMGYLQILQSRVQGNAMAEEMMARMSRELDRVDGLIGGLLEYSRPTGKDLQPLSGHDVLRGAVDLLKSQKPFREIEIALDFKADDDRFMADPQGLQQIFINLLLNAADAVNRKGRLILATQACSGGVLETVHGWQPPLSADFGSRLFFRAEVTDSGPGIAPELLDRIFEPFFTTKDVGQGTGLGLAVVERLVRGYHGHIRAANRPGGGASFFLLFPLLKVDA